MKSSIIFFDVGNTLIHSIKPVAEIYSDFSAEYGEKLSAEIVGKNLKIVWNEMLTQKLKENKLKYGIDNETSKKWWGKLVKKVFNISNYNGNIDLLFENIYEYFATEAPWVIYEDALDTIDYVKGKGYKTGIISNWDVRLSNILDKLKLTPYFDWIFISCDVGYEKPDERIFKKALEETKFEPLNAFHIGDSFKEDILGALSVGINPIFIKRNKEFSHNNINEDINRYNINDIIIIDYLKEIRNYL